MTLPIVKYNAPVLRQKGDIVTTFNKELSQLSSDMVETMHAANGIGLAAQQVGKAIQLCVVDILKATHESSWNLDGSTPPLELIMPLTLVNPKVKILPSDDYIYEEGCLSFPGIHGDVVRPDAIRVVYQDLQGIPHTLTTNDLFARCIQHEVDHLNGILFIDRMSKKVRKKLKVAIEELAKKTKENPDL